MWHVLVRSTSQLGGSAQRFCGEGRIVELPDHLPEGWDLADAIPDGINLEELIRAARSSPAPPSLPHGYFFTQRGLVWREEGEALAVHSKAQLITADERLANSLAAHFPVRWLGAV